LPANDIVAIPFHAKDFFYSMFLYLSTQLQESFFGKKPASDKNQEIKLANRIQL